MNTTSSSRADTPAQNVSPATRYISFSSLVLAEFHRARQTRSTLAAFSVVVAVALVMVSIRALLSENSGAPLESASVTLNTDLIGFAAFLIAAIGVAKDHQTGTIDLLRTLSPARTRHLAARAVGIGILALVCMSIVVLGGVVMVLVLNPAALDLELVDAVVRGAITVLLLTTAGVGIGAVTRSTAAATFAVLTLYWLLPIAFIIAGLAGGITWATPASEITLGPLVGDAILPGREYWTAAGGVALWSLALCCFGILRETKGS